MKIISTFLFAILLTAPVFAQKTTDILATANGQTFTVKDLSAETQKLRINLPTLIAETRSRLLRQMITDNLLEIEAQAKNSTVEKLLDEAESKVAAPPESEIKAVYEANRAALGGQTLEQTRPQIVAFLRREPAQKALQNYVDALQTKYKVSYGKDVNAPNPNPSDTLAVVGGKTISVQQFDEKNKLALYEIRADAFDAVKSDLTEIVFNNLIAAEAKAQGIEAGDLLAREITDKMRDFSDEEKFNLTSGLKNKLFTKYKAAFSLEEPAPVVQNIGIETSPSRGNAAAPVTIVMFSDFQCSHCAAAHPILQKLIGEYQDKIRFVVRNYPLSTIHGNAFSAALAANAAGRQGRFFEYIDVLYKNQDKLDTVSLKKYAADLGLNPKQFEIDLTDEKNAAAVKKDVADGTNYGITGTPTIFVNGIKVRDNSAEGFRGAIEKALAK